MFLFKMMPILFIFNLYLFASETKQKVHALYIPLADHYAALVAYERYAKEMKHADFHITQMKNWDLLRAYFQSGEVDMAYVMTPLAIDMFNENPHFRWIGLMHRDGNALAINHLLKKDINLEKNRINRKPNADVALALKKAYKKHNKPTQIGLPHLLSTHAVILYRHLKEHDSSITFTPNNKADVLGISVAPPKAPAFIKIKSKKAIPAAFEQSLPWADVVETGGYGKVAWYSKDVMPWKYGHVECISLATDKAIKDKFKAIQEVQYYIHKAGADIEKAKEEGRKSLDKIVEIVRKHIPLHTAKAIKASLRYDLEVINYKHLNIDKKGLKLIMDYAIEGKTLKQGLDIDTFADERFKVNL
ncbi:MAG TPA: nitrate ABC transporter substrate-binding protein [Sulfurimonas sp.]|nr:nitrate ABC transporter substrate-binding protein [Sulfurimonas sp.]